MKEHLYNFIRLSFFLTMATFLQACGGSSDDNSDNYSISASTSSITFANEFLQVSDDTFKVTVNFEGNGLLVGFSPNSSPVGWLNFRTENVTATSADVYVSVVDVENAITDLYETTLRLTTGDIDKLNLVHHDIDVSLLIWQLTADKELLTFQGTLGDSAINAQTLAITSASNEWSISTDVDWLTIDTSEGVGDGVVTITPDVSTLTSSQLYNANIVLTEKTTGDSKQIPVELGLDGHRLFSPTPTVSLAKLANINATSSTISIKNNSNTGIPWQATSNVDWLTLTPLIETNELVISINHEASITNAHHQATVTLNGLTVEGTIDDAVSSETISISYYQSAESSVTNVIENIQSNDNAVVSSPLLPYVYVGQNNQLNIYHQYSAELITSVSVSPENTLLEQLIIHPEGDFIIAQADETITNDDETTSTLTHRYRINLTDNAVTEIESPTIEFDPFTFATFSGKHFIVTQALEFADDNLQRLFWDNENAYFTTRADQAQQTEAFYALDLSDSSFNRYTATVDDFTAQQIVVTQTHEYRPELLGENQAVSDFIVDESDMNIYAVSPTSEWISFDGETFTDNGLLPQADASTALSLTKSRNNRALFTRFTQTEGFYIDVYNNQQALINSISTLGLQPSSIHLSADNKRMVINAQGDEQLEIINIEQINTSLSAVNFETTFGNAEVENQTITVTGVSDSWHLTTDQDWLIATSSAIDEGHQIELSIDESQLSGWGLFTASVIINDTVSGTSSVVTVDIAVDEVRLFSNYPALAFHEQADRSFLTHTVKILTNKASAVDWQATTSESWLVLLPDTDNNTLTITVDPDLVTEHGHYESKITLSPLNAGESINGEINISFTKGGFDTTELSEVIIEDITPNDTGIVLDLMRPYIYVSQANNLDVYSIIDGSKITTIEAPITDATFDNLVLHPDGLSMLFSNEETYTDENDAEQQRTNYYFMNLADYSISAINNEEVDILSTPQKIIMVSGMPVVVTQALELANLSLVQQYWDSENYFFPSFVNDIADNNNFFAYDANNFNIQRNSLAYNAFADNVVSFTGSSDYVNPELESGLRALATDSDGTNIYTANGSSERSEFDGETYIDQGKVDSKPLATPVSVVTDNQNNSYFYRFDNAFGFFTLTRYDDAQLNTLFTGYTAGSVDVYISPDYHRILHYNSSENQLVIDYIPE